MDDNYIAWPVQTGDDNKASLSKVLPTSLRYIGTENWVLRTPHTATKDTFSRHLLFATFLGLLVAR